MPQNVANLCNWTLVCSNSDVHANNTGHGKIDAAQSALAVATAALPGAPIGTPYSTTLSATGGIAPYKWKKIGKLPQGLKITPKTGVISGTPKTKAATSTFQVQVRDSTKPKLSATKTFTITVS